MFEIWRKESAKHKPYVLTSVVAKDQCPSVWKLQFFRDNWDQGVRISIFISGERACLIHQFVGAVWYILYPPDIELDFWVVSQRLQAGPEDVLLRSDPVYWPYRCQIMLQDWRSDT